MSSEIVENKKGKLAAIGMSWALPQRSVQHREDKLKLLNSDAYFNSDSLHSGVEQRYDASSAGSAPSRRKKSKSRKSDSSYQAADAHFNAEGFPALAPAPVPAPMSDGYPNAGFDAGFPGASASNPAFGGGRSWDSAPAQMRHLKRYHPQLQRSTVELKTKLMCSFQPKLMVSC